MKRIIILFLFGGLLSTHIFATDNLRIPDLRTLSMGGCGVTEVPLFNPAILGTKTYSKIYASYYNRYSVSELATVNGGFYYVNDIMPIGIDITSFGYDEYRESLFRLSMGKQIAQQWTIGIAIQYAMLQSELFEDVSGRVSADVGITYRPVENLLTGLSVLHMPSVKVGDKNIENKHIAPYSINMGFNWDVTNTMLITGSVSNNEEDALTGSFGIEYLPFDDFRIRIGIKTSPLMPSLGVGYNFSGIDIDVGMIYHSVLGVSTGFGLSFSF
jgi:hypothetical protein